VATLSSTKTVRSIDYKETKIFAYLAPFTVEGDVELIRVGYECGFGDGNSKGLGMVESMIL
jgi:CRISPR-associated endoribonuclease Cas6